MSCCGDPKPLVYKTRRSPSWVTRYRRCRHCGECSKTIQRGFTDGRSWFDRGDSLPDRRDSGRDDAIMVSGDSLKLEAYDDERFNWFT
jgi:hypothetical protein